MNQMNLLIFENLHTEILFVHRISSSLGNASNFREAKELLGTNPTDYAVLFYPKNEAQNKCSICRGKSGKIWKAEYIV